MHIQVVHSTVYRYGGAVHPEAHTFRLRPREDGVQRLLHYSLEIAPAPALRTECLDQDGNVVTETWFSTPAEELRVRSSFEVETLRANPFDFVLSEEGMRSAPLVYREPVRAALAAYLGTGTGSAAVRELAASIRARASGQTLPFLTELNRFLFEDFRHVVRDHGPAIAPEATLAAGEGSCRDLAVLFCDVCRELGIAARFVSGYEREASLQERADMHAWAEVYLEGGGWRGYDPSQGLAVADSHVVVAAAADARLAAPISGSYRGSVGSQMEYRITMRVDGEGV